jgi:SAM-dependent methyltransferase
VSYLLGHDATEQERLFHQHVLWRGTLLPTLEQVGVRPGASVLEVGCGTGVLLADIAEMVLPTGLAAGLERSHDAAEAARGFLGDRATVVEGDLMETDLEGPWDVVVARWVLSFVPDTARAIARLAEALRPGGALVIQDYNHDGLGTWPVEPALVRAIDAVRAAYRARGGDLFVANRVPGLMQAAGLRVEGMGPHVMASGPGGGPFQWVERFFLDHLASWVADGHLTQAESDACRAAWDRLRARPDAVLYTPMVVTIVGRR